MNERRQSYNERQIVPRETKKGSPVGPVPLGMDSDQFDYTDEVNDNTSGDDSVEPTQLPAPRNLVIKNQTIRFGPDGTQYVDVVVEFDDVENAASYESRVAAL